MWSVTCLELPVELSPGASHLGCLILTIPTTKGHFQCCHSLCHIWGHLGEETKGKPVGRPRYPHLAKRRSVEEEAKPMENHGATVAL